MRPNRMVNWRRVMGGLLGVILVGGVSVLVVLQEALDRSNTIAAVVSAVATVLMLVGGPWGGFFKNEEAGPVLDAADDLAYVVLNQWETVLADRSLHKPPPIHVGWSAVDRPDANPSNSGTSHAIFDGPSRQQDGTDKESITEAFSGLPHRRLVITGEPGAGKTVMAMRLAVDFLKKRDAGALLAVYLPVSSWNPNAMDLNDWIIRRIAQDYYSGRMRTPRELIRRHLILPVLDGLDDLPEQLRPRALEAIDRATHAERPMIVTCRAAEYSRMISSARSAFAAATVVTLEPVSTADAIHYLRKADPGGATRWNELAETLNEYPECPVAGALSTPLMVYLARATYAISHAAPTELLDEVRFPTRESVEEHFLESYIEAAYPELPRRMERGQADIQWDGRRAEAWLSFLARRLNRLKTIELSWWRLDRVGSIILTALAVLSLFCVFGWIGWGVAHHLFAHSRSPGWYAGSLGLPTGIALAFLPAGVLLLAVQGSRGMAGGNELGALISVPLSALIVFAAWVARAKGFGGYVVSGLTGGLLGLALGYASWMIVGNINRREWRRELADGTVSFSGCVGVLFFLLLLGAYLPSFILSHINRHTSGWILVLFWMLAFLPAKIFLGGRRGPRGPLEDWFEERMIAPVLKSITNSFDAMSSVPGTQARAGLVDPNSSLRSARTATLVSSVLVTSMSELGIIVSSRPHASWAAATFLSLSAGLGVAASSAWGRFVANRIWLWSRGKSPLRMMAFLDDAVRRGVLRQVGPTYQFRHTLLQESLTRQEK
jgi:hypothetical protein